MTGEVDRMAVHPLPVYGQGGRYLAQNVRRQMRNPDPRQNQEARVVSDEADVAPARFGAPSYITVAAAQMTRGRTPCHAGDWPAFRPYQILQVFADGLFVTKIMMLFHQTVEQRLVGRFSDLLQQDRTNGAEWGIERRRVGQHGLWPLTPGQWIGRTENESPATRSGLRGAASTAGRGTPYRVERRWPASIAMPRRVSPTVCGGSRSDVR